MEPKTTPPSPGPYRFDPVGLLISDTDGYPVAHVNQRKEPTKDSDETTSTGWLLTAAPELLEHLKGIVEMAHAVSANWENGCLDAAVRYLDRIATTADVAIRKAEGRHLNPYRVWITEKQHYMIDLWAEDEDHARCLALDDYSSQWSAVDGHMESDVSDVQMCEDKDFCPVND